MRVLTYNVQAVKDKERQERILKEIKSKRNTQVSTGSYDHSEGHAAKSCEDSDSLRERTQSPTGEMYSIT